MPAGIYSTSTQEQVSYIADHCQAAVAVLESRADFERLPSLETIKKFTILPEPFSVEGGELSPTLKMRRKAIASKYQAEIDALYA